MTLWARLAESLAAQAPHTTQPCGGRLAAALVLVRDRDGDLEVVYTRRREELRHHPGQISFPGGRVERGETAEQAALREAHEEIALDVATVEVLGRLPATYIPPSRFWLQPVVARWRAPHPLVAAETEVAAVLRVRLSSLRDVGNWRMVRLSTRGDSWAWQLDADHLLWGATAVITVSLLDLLIPDWHGGTALGDLATAREARPWDVPGRLAPLPSPAMLPGVPEVPADSAPVVRSDGWRRHARDVDVVEGAAAAATRAIGLLVQARDAARVLVLAGPGRTGAAGVASARALAAAGVRVAVVCAGRPTPAGDWAAGAPSSPGDRLPVADVVLDAVTGGGLRGALRGAPRDAVLALRHVSAPIISLDLPSGLHPDEGLVGELVTADVTVALGAPRAGLFRPGIGPFVGDLYLADLGWPEAGHRRLGAPRVTLFAGGPLVRLVPGPSAAPDRWRE